MGSFRFPVPSAIGITEAFGDLPQSLRAYMREGFATLAQLDSSRRNALVPIAIEAVNTPYRIDETEVAKQLDMSPEQAGPVISATSFLTALLSGRKDRPEEVIDAAVRAGLISSGSREAALAFCSAVAPQRDALKRALESSRLATRVLPSMSEFEIAVELRLSFKAGKLDLAVPVAVAHIDTDAAGEELWFQMQKADVEKLVDRLGRLKNQLTEAEKWAEQQAKSQS